MFHHDNHVFILLVLSSEVTKMNCQESPPTPNPSPVKREGLSTLFFSPFPVFMGEGLGLGEVSHQFIVVRSLVHSIFFLHSMVQALQHKKISSDHRHNHGDCCSHE